MRAEPTNAGESDLRVVVDVQIVLAMFLIRRDRPDAIEADERIMLRAESARGGFQLFLAA